MSFSVRHTLAGLAALSAVACLAAVPAEARDCRKSCATSKSAGKVVRYARYEVTQGRMRAERRRLARSDARQRRRVAVYGDPSWFVWHGWAGSFHLNGVRYPGGNPRGPAASYNNWEGGFHPVAYWKLMERNGP